jgi:hypothetical protein
MYDGYAVPVLHREGLDLTFQGIVDAERKIGRRRRRSSVAGRRKAGASASREGEDGNEQ